MSSTSSVFDLSSCTLCPRECRANRLAGELGLCGIPAQVRAARAALLFYEEPCISGLCGSGAIFFTGCNLGCVFCQNAAISSGLHTSGKSGFEHYDGSVLSSDALARIMLQLQEQGASNINLVTPSHVLHVLIPALEKAKGHGLQIPIVYNTSAYEKAEVIHALDGLIDIYLPDLKFYSSELAQQYAHAADYWECAISAIDEMIRQCPEPIFADGSHSLDADDDSTTPLMKRGVIVRHMVMPGHTEDSRKILQYLHSTYHEQIFLSIMNQYTPMPDCADDPLLSRPVTQKEYDEVVDFAISIGVENGFLQEGGTISKSFIPAWDGTGLSV